MKKESLSDEDLAKERERLVRELKKNVKQIMEESIAKKTVHEDSSNVASVCSTVDTCLNLGLRRRALGLFKTSSSLALLHKIGKENEDSAAVIKSMEELKSSGGGSTSSSDSVISFNTKSIQRMDSSGFLSQNTRFYWIRIALFEKRLHRIVNYLVNNADRFYESKKSLVGDADYGPLISSLLVGPCALVYSKGAILNHYWMDPPADELVQRHRISSATCKGSQPSTPSRSFKRMLSSPHDFEERRGSIPHLARDYVESIHQNQRSFLLYGKNNIDVGHEKGSIPGYLSLHKEADNSILLKWTPNVLMDARSNSNCVSPHNHSTSPAAATNLTSSSPGLGANWSSSPGPGGTWNSPAATWQLAININLVTVNYLHSHQDNDGSGHLVLVGSDGVQYPPIHFQSADHMISFLSILESSLDNLGVLSPSVAAHNNQNREEQDCAYKLHFFENNLESVPENANITKANSIEWFSNLFNKTKKTLNPVLNGMDTNTEVSPAISMEDELNKMQSDERRCSSQSSKSTVSCTTSPSTPLKGLCQTMRSQLISRAFYGWKEHCKHMKTVRTHLSGLILPDFTPEWLSESSELSELGAQTSSTGLTSDLWAQFQEQGLQSTEVQSKIYRLIYAGGIQHQLRKEVWLYLLGHLDWSFTQQQIVESTTQSEYEACLSEWGALEAIVQQQDKELCAANMARLEGHRSESLSEKMISEYKRMNSTPEYSRGNSMPNDVFESIDSVPEYSESNTTDRPSTITEVTEQSSDSHSCHTPAKSGSTSSSSARMSCENRLDDRNLFLKAASDEGIEDIHVEDHMESKNIQQQISGEDIDVDDEPTIAEFGVKITTPSVDSGNADSSPPEDRVLRGGSDQLACHEIQQITHQINSLSNDFRDDLLAPSHPTSVCPSPASSEGGTYSLELLESFGLNLHRIDKDVARCDRNLEYFSKHKNLEKLRNVITTYVWENLEVGYMQGMCDIAAPLLTVFEEESTVYSCFKLLMSRMIKNFPHGDQMDSNFANMRALMQVLDPNLFEKVQQNGDFSHFYFCYRWFLLDFKREFDYDCVYRVWETIWTASRVSSEHFYLFFALGLVETYRDIILDRNMDFTDIIKFFNEMSERHDLNTVLMEANTLVNNLHQLLHDVY